MALRAGFVGINRHADPRVSDLTGAVADATALWALFSDSAHSASTQSLEHWGFNAPVRPL